MDEEYKQEPKFKIGDIVAMLDDRGMIPKKMEIYDCDYIVPKKDSFGYQERPYWYYHLKTVDRRNFNAGNEDRIVLYSDLEQADGEINYSVLCYYKLCELVDMSNGYDKRPSVPLEWLKNLHRK